MGGPEKNLTDPVKIVEEYLRLHMIPDPDERTCAFPMTR